MGVVLERIQSSRWFQNYETKLMVIAFPIALLLSLLPMIVGIFIPQIATVYLISAYLVVFLAIFGICIILLGFHNKVARRLVLTVAITSFLGAFAHFWLLIETIFLGLPLNYPNTSTYITAAANTVLLIGFALVSIEQRRRSLKQIAGYVLTALFFGVCILSVYQLNLTFHPPELVAIGSGVRVLLGFFTAIFAWAFFFNQNPPKEVIGRSSRLLLLSASLVLILGYTASACQYAFGWQDVSSFYYAGSLSDSISLFAIFIFCIAVLAIFSETIENMATTRPVSVKYEIISRVLLIFFSFIGMILILTIAITLFGRVLLFYLSPADALIGLQTVGIGSLMGFVAIVLVFSAIGHLLARWLFRPLAHLETETMAITEPGIVSYSEPPGLVFTELQSVSDSFSAIMNELSRVRAEMRRFTVTEPRLRAPSTSQLSRLDYYLAILNNSITNQIQTIMNLTEVGRNVTKEEQNNVLDMIQNEMTEMHYLLRSVQILRLIDSQALPEFHRIDLVPIMTKLLTELQEVIPETTSQISLSLPPQKAFVLANEYVKQIFQPLFRLALERDVGGPSTVEVTFTKIEQYGTSFWQINISHPKWVLSDLEKVLLFRADQEQPQKANPSLLLVPALVEYFRGKFYVKNIVIDDPQYGTTLQVLLPLVTTRNSRPPKSSNDTSRS